MYAIATVAIIVLAAVVAATVLEIKSSKEEEISEWMDYIEDLCGEKNICPEFVEAIIEYGSGWDPKAVNGGCVGLMQIPENIHHALLEELGVDDLEDPYGNICVGVHIINELFKKYSDPALVVILYYGGDDAERFLETWEIPEYANIILERSAELEREHGK